ncbi:MAG: Bax inhibitor-1/YccA family protein [Chloroflexi bacterium]|nr:Bax inhibitor-1/YccA family protein [Chloroflexota bacterium]
MFNNNMQERQYAPSMDIQTLFQGVFLWMMLGLLTTAAVAFITVSTPLVELAASPLVFVAFIAEIGLVIWLGRSIANMSVQTTATVFLLYAALNGFSLSLILLFFDVGTIGTAFFTTSAVFGAMVVVGRTTDLDLTKMGSILLMALIGLIIAVIVNMFIASSMANLIISVAGVIIFTGLTAYDAQRIQQMAYTYSGTSSIAVYGALILYLDFINLFLFLLRLLSALRD